MHHDIIIVGAGLSGVDAGYRLQTMSPGKDYVILEGREAPGGTWDLFRYPGVRSDSDMFTLGFPFEPWPGEKSLASGDQIREYIRSTAAKHGIDQRIRFSHKVTGATWSSEDARWTLRVDTPDGQQEFTADFLYLCAGYFNYDHGYIPDFDGREDFRGEVVHPQFWPQDLRTSGRKVIVIGSGATAMSLVPALVEGGAQVTMLQRSPTYVISQPEVDPIAKMLRKRLSPRRAYALVRLKNARTSLGFYKFSRKQPRLARALLRRMAMSQLKGSAVGAEHFTPRYNVWDQRLCVLPGGDLLTQLKEGRAQIVTDTVDRFVPEGIRTGSGRIIEADIIVTATGLSMLAGGGVQVEVDGEPITLHDHFLYRSALISGVPNLAVCVGYINASWTLRADLTSTFVARLVNHLDEGGYAYCVAQPQEPLEGRPALPLDAGYVLRGVGGFPQQGDKEPWVFKQNWFADRKEHKDLDLTDSLVFVRRGESPAAGAHESSPRTVGSVA